MIDIAEIDTNDSQAVGQLVDRIRYHLDAEQCVDFLVALLRWAKVRDAPTTPSHARYMCEFEEWRQFVLQLPDVQHVIGADA